MRKLVLALIMAGFYALSANAQTTADFTFSNVCFGDSTTLTSTSTSTNTILQLNWDIDSNGLFTDDIGSMVKWRFPVFKVYQVGLEVITNLDTVVVYKNVITKATPTANFNIDYPKQCLSSNFFSYTNASTLASGSLSYFWDLGNGSTSNTATDTNCIYFASGTFPVKLIATSDSGCVDSIVKNIEVLTASVVDFVANDTDQCLLGNTFVLTDNSLMCDPVLSFSWDLDGDGVFGDSINQSPLNLIITTPGPHQVGLKVTTTLGGVDSIYKTMYVYPTPASSFSITSDSGQCLAGNSFTFNNTTVLGGPGSITYLWNFGDGDTSTSVNPAAHNYASVAVYSVKLLATSDMNCADSVILNATIFPQPNVDFMFADSGGCTADTFKMANMTSIPAPWTLTYSWDFGDASTDTAKDQAHNYISSGNYNVKLIAVSDSGCSDSITKMAYVYAQSIARFNINDTDQCLNGNTFMFTDNSITCSPVVSIEWDYDNDGVADALGDTVYYSFSLAGLYNVGMRLTTSTDTDSISYSMTIYPDPIVDFTVNDSTQAIASNNFIFTNTSTLATGTLSYLWDFADGDTSTTTNPTHVYAGLGIYPVKLIATSGAGCTDSMSHNMYVSSALNLGFISFDVCDGDSMSFLDTTNSGSPILSIDWDMNNDMQFTDATGSAIKYLFPSSGIFMVGMKVTTATAVDTLYKSVTVNEMPIVDFTFSEACQGSTTSLFDQSSTVNDPIVKYYWDFNNDGLPDDSNTNANTIFTVAGTNLVGHAVVTSKGCFDIVIKTVKVNFQPNADFSFSDNCFGDSTLFTNNTVILNDTVINYLWDYGDGTDAIIKHNHKHYFSLDGTYAVRLITLSNKGCRDTVTKSLTIHPQPALNLLFSGDTTFYDGQSVTITAGPGPYDSIFWSTGQTTAAVTATTQGVYTIRVVDSNNCSAKDSTLVTVINVTEFKANEVLTPNGDNINDYWIIYNLPFYAPVDVTIYNRWGDVLYNSTNYQNTWDASYNGTNLPEGTYYYIIRTKTNDVYKGSINIIR